MNGDQSGKAGPRQQLSLMDTTCIIVGIIIGAGFFETTPLIAANATGPLTWLYEQVYQWAYGADVHVEVPLDVIGPISLAGVWILGGVFAMIGALCYAELTTKLPREGGDYVFLSEAYGRRLGFLFVWCEFWIVRPCSIGAMGFVFARYAQQVLPIELSSDSRSNLVIWSCAAIVVLTATNLLGVRAGKTTQNFLTWLKVIGMLAIVVVGLFGSSSTNPQPMEIAPDSTSFGLAMIMVLFAFGGWNDMSFVAAEVKEPSRNLSRSLLIGTCSVAAIYVICSAALVYGLGYANVASSRAVAADLFTQVFGSWGRRAISVLICISSLGALNGMLFTGARIYFAMGRKQRPFRWLGAWSDRWDGPVRSFLLQSTITLATVVAFGLYKSGQNADGSGGASGFERVVVFSAPLFWCFLLLVGIALFLLRWRRPKMRGSFTVPWYPVTPTLFCAGCLFMVYESTSYAWNQQFWEGLVAVGVIVAGIVVSLFSGAENPSD